MARTTGRRFSCTGNKKIEQCTTSQFTVTTLRWNEQKISLRSIVRLISLLASNAIESFHLTALHRWINRGRVYGATIAFQVEGEKLIAPRWNRRKYTFDRLFNSSPRRTRLLRLVPSRSTRKNRQVGNVGTYKTSLRLLLNFVDEQMAPPRRVPRASGSSYFLLRTTQNVCSIALNSFLVERRGKNKEESRKEWNDEWKSASNGPSPHAGNSSRFNKKTF